jgi:hypothetical protein
MPLRVYSGFLGRLPLDSREYAVLKTAVGEGNLPTDYTVEILCDASDARLLLKRATEFYPEALPFIQLGMDVCIA